MRKKLKRVTALLLTFIIAITLLPVTPAAAQNITVGSDVTLPVEGFNAGTILKYSEVGNGVVKIEVGVYKVVNTAIFDLRLKYDKSVVSLAKNAAGTLVTTYDTFTTIMGNNTSVIPTSLRVEGGPPLVDPTWTKGLDSDKADSFADWVPLQYAPKPVTHADINAGTVSVSMATKTTDLMGTMASIYVNGFVGTSPNTELNMGGNEDFISLYSLYFKTIDSQTITGDTFQLTIDPMDNIAPKGVALTKADGTAWSEDALFIGFPEVTPPAATTYPVKVIVGPTANEETAALAGTNNTWLTAPNIQLWKADGNNGNVVTTNGYPKEFTSTTDAKGLLISGGAVIEGGSGVLKLEEGWYKYEVTPTGQTSVYASNTGFFQVAAGDQTVRKQYIHAKAASAAEAKDFALSLLDGESADRQTAFGSGTVTATLGGVALGNLTIADGQITLNTVPGDTAKTLVLEKAGYVTRTLTDVVFPTSGTITGTGITNGALVLNQRRSDITLTAPTSPAYFTISAKPSGTVTPNMATNELPMTVAADGAGNTATVSLPDGDYVYTMVTPGNQNMDKELTVKGNDSPAKITISDVGGSNPSDLSVTDKGDGTGNKSTADSTTTGTPSVISDPMYQVVGEWAKTGETVTGMTVKVYLKNIKATQGTFGLRYDPAVFTLNTAGFVSDAKIQVPEKQVISVNGHSGSTNNPTVESGYHAFRWNAAGTGDSVVAVDGTTNAALIATYNLGLTAAALNGGYKTMMHDKSLYVQPYAKTVGAAEIKAIYNTAGALDSYPLFIADLWRPTDGANTAPDAGRLATDKAMMGGFHQVTNATVEGDTWDVLSQFVFENTTGRPAIYFSVAEKDTNLAIKDAAVSVQQGGDEVAAGKTDTFGDAIIPVPKEDAYDYGVSAEGYQSVTGSVAKADMGSKVSVVLNLSDMHKVRIHDDQKISTTLIGNGAQNGVDYFFMLTPQPGYVWPNGLPAAADLEIKQVAKGSTYEDSASTVISTGKLTWDAAKNQYKLDKTAITGVSTDDLVIKVVNENKKPTPTPANNNHTVTVTAGAHGGFSYVDVTPDSDFDKPGPITGPGTVVETLGLGESVSAKYTITGEGTVNANATEAYTAWIIDKVFVNGTALTLSDKDRIYGLKDFQLVGITANQTIAATFCKATIQPGEPGNPDDDTIDPNVPITPADESIVTVTISDHGSAAVTVNAPSATGNLTGPASGSYIVGATTGTLGVTFTGAGSVTAPDGTTVKYVIDTVRLDGVDVTATLTGAGSDTLTLSNLTAGTSHQVVATFKPENGTTIYASLELVHYAGDGTATPIGNSIWPVGLPAAIQLDPASGWQLGAVDLTKPGDSGATDVTKNAVAGSDASYTYTTPSLTAGITKVGFQFKEHTYKVEVLMNYAMRGSANVVPYTPATFTFTRTSGIPLTITYGPSETGEYKLAKPTQKEAGLRFDLPLGTWSLTVSKHGYLNYVVTDFVIAMDSGTLKAGSAGDLTAVIGTAGSEQLIYFGRTGSESKSRSVAPIIGDATWDGKLIAANDIGQVANGMVSGATPAQKTRADIDESILTSGAGTVNAADMSYVVENYGAVRTNLTYSDFMNLSISGS